MKRLDLRNMKKLTDVEMSYISDLSAMCLEFIDGEHHSMFNPQPSEVICSIAWKNFDYLDKLDVRSSEYVYARYVWAIEITESDERSTTEFCSLMKDVFITEKEELPACIREAIQSIEDSKLRERIYKSGEYVYNYSKGDIDEIYKDSSKIHSEYDSDTDN